MKAVKELSERMEGKKQLFRDKNVKPTEQLIAEALGEGYTIYQRFIETLENEGISLMDWRYYQDGKAWLSKGEYKWTTTRGTNKVKPIFWLSMWEGFFKYGDKKWKAKQSFIEKALDFYLSNNQEQVERGEI